MMEDDLHLLLSIGGDCDQHNSEEEEEVPKTTEERQEISQPKDSTSDSFHTPSEHKQLERIERLKRRETTSRQDNVHTQRVTAPGVTQWKKTLYVEGEYKKRLQQKRKSSCSKMHESAKRPRVDSMVTSCRSKSKLNLALHTVDQQEQRRTKVHLV